MKPTAPLTMLTLLLPLLLAACTSDTASQENLTVTEVASGLGIPWGMTFIDEGEILFTEKAGRVRVLDLDNGQIRDIAGAPAVDDSGQGGLMDVVTGPDFATSRWLYFTYAKPGEEGAATTLARAKLAEGELVDWEDLLVTQSVSGTGRHFGSRIAFDGRGHLYFGVGDRGVRDSAQNLDNHAGTLMRLGLDGSVPGDNPFVGRDGLDEIWSYGHRNPQGLAYDTRNDRLWAIEHGPRGGDEINRVEPGRNYGWPVISYGREYMLPKRVGEATEKEGMEQPVKYYDPSIAPGSLLLYRGEAFPEWQGDLFAGALVLTHLNRIDLDARGNVVGEQRLLEDEGERIRALAEGPAGAIYLSTDSGRILRLTPDN